MIHYLSFCVWLISLSIVFSSFIHIIVFIGIFFLFMAEYYSSDVYTTVCLSTDGHLVFFHLLALVNSAMSMGIQLWVPVFNSFGYISRSGIDRAFCNYLFNLLRNYQTVFPQQLHHSAFPPAMHEGSSFSTSSPTLIFCLNNSRSKGCSVVSHCDFDLHFPDD